MQDQNNQPMPQPNPAPVTPTPPVQPAGQSPTPQVKQSNTGIIVAIIAFVAIFVGGAFAARFMVNNNSNSLFPNTSTNANNDNNSDTIPTSSDSIMIGYSGSYFKLAGTFSDCAKNLAEKYPVYYQDSNTFKYIAITDIDDYLKQIDNNHDTKAEVFVLTTYRGQKMAAISVSVMDYSYKTKVGEKISNYPVDVHVHYLPGNKYNIDNHIFECNKTSIEDIRTVFSDMKKDRNSDNMYYGEYKNYSYFVYLYNDTFSDIAFFSE
jgi:hypothetical protein